MTQNDLLEAYRKFEIPGHLAFQEGNGELTKIEVTTPGSELEMYLHGAHITHYQRNGEPPLLFLSQLSRFAPDQAIRGGIPIVFPWFGPREGEPMHGFARLESWEVQETSLLAEGAVRLRLRLPDCAEAASLPPFTADYIVTVDNQLRLDLIVTNRASEPFVFENCLHTYLAVGDIRQVTVHGLQGVDYLDKIEHFARKTESEDALQIQSELDRIYLHTTSAVEVRDLALNRRIQVHKTGSASTVVWNPWIAKGQQMPDFGNEDYRQMVCVESGNVDQDRLTLAPGQSSTLSVQLATRPL